jgi:SAM-dependent methyltransferase
MNKLFSDPELFEIYYSQVKKPDSYFTKYDNGLPPCPIEVWDKQWGTHDMPRVFCLLDIQEWAQKHQLFCNKLAYTFNRDPELEFIVRQSETYLPYPEYDLHTIGDKFKEEFDFFLFSQTLEHLYNPFKAVAEIYKTLKPGGYVFTSVPTLNIPHGTPIHYGGFNPMGLAMLFKTNGFDIVEIGQWGNYEYIQRLWSDHEHLGYDQLNHDNVVTNEERNVCQCWILARKPF